jgi:hypothetical protein
MIGVRTVATIEWTAATIAACDELLAALTRGTTLPVSAALSVRSSLVGAKTHRLELLAPGHREVKRRLPSFLSRNRRRPGGQSHEDSHYA